MPSKAAKAGSRVGRVAHYSAALNTSKIHAFIDIHHLTAAESFRSKRDNSALPAWGRRRG